MPARTGICSLKFFSERVGLHFYSLLKIHNFQQLRLAFDVPTKNSSRYMVLLILQHRELECNVIAEVPRAQKFNSCHWLRGEIDFDE